MLDLGGKSGKFDVIVPYTKLDGTAQYQGQPVERVVEGFGTPAFRLSINLHGAPALALREFSAWKQDLIIGVSLQVSPPWAQYDADRIVNIGSNRWSFKPEVGISKAIGPWTLEAQAAARFFTDNDDFYGGNTRSQDPLYSLQGHVIYGFRSGKWISVDGTYFAGGRSTINDARNNDLQQNWRVGRDPGDPGEPAEFDQVLRQQWRVGAHRQQLRCNRRRVAVSLGGRSVISTSVGDSHLTAHRQHGTSDRAMHGNTGHKKTAVLAGRFFATRAWGGMNERQATTKLVGGAGFEPATLAV